MAIRKWTKIFALGDRHTQEIFNEEVSITEKVDGSQVNFGIDEHDHLNMLSKGSTFHVGDNNKLFAPAALTITHLADSGKLVKGWSYHGETLYRGNHNILAYDRVPQGNIALYGVTKTDGSLVSSYDDLAAIAHTLGVGVVPELWRGTVDRGDASNVRAVMDLIEKLLETDSYLGGQKIEGVVIKNTHREIMVGGQLYPLVQAKFVSERFKEKHKADWNGLHNKPVLQMIGELFKTPARWEKAIIHHKESGENTGTPKDIGPLLKLLHKDIDEEDRENIKELLFKSFSKEIKRAACAGFPEWYKEFLVGAAFNPTQIAQDDANLVVGGGVAETVNV